MSAFRRVEMTQAGPSGWHPDSAGTADGCCHSSARVTLGPSTRAGAATAPRRLFYVNSTAMKPP